MATNILYLLGIFSIKSFIHVLYILAINLKKLCASILRFILLLQTTAIFKSLERFILSPDSKHVTLMSLRKSGDVRFFGLKIFYFYIERLAILFVDVDRFLQEFLLFVTKIAKIKQFETKNCMMGLTLTDLHSFQRMYQVIISANK